MPIMHGSPTMQPASTVQGSPVIVKLAGELAEGCTVDGGCVSMLRPRSTITKSYEADAILGQKLSPQECFESAVQPHLRAALATGRSASIYAMGSEQSGKTTTVRSEEGIAIQVARDLFAYLGDAPPGIESLVTVTGVLCAIMPSAGPSKEVLLDALGEFSGSAPCLTVHEQTDGLPTHAPFYCKGVKEVEAADAAAAESLVRQAVGRCAQEEGGTALRVHLLLTFALRQRAAADGTERSLSVSVCDVAGVPRPSRAADGGRASGAAAGRGRGAARGRGGAGGVGEDPFVKALHRIIDTLPDATPKVGAGSTCGEHMQGPLRSLALPRLCFLLLSLH